MNSKYRQNKADNHSSILNDYLPYFVEVKIFSTLVKYNLPKEVVYLH
ncbi:hypothetical protein SAMN04488574_101121 [Bacillus sp. 71mf]|nr:hypothetical protein SAMN04488574_101121 [Bacillus sp. 71mf]SFS94032.1 hypothetical protein SAMN04488145_105169 [Bacillus sp. 103mf]